MIIIIRRRRRKRKIRSRRIEGELINLYFFIIVIVAMDFNEEQYLNDIFLREIQITLELFFFH